MKNQKVKKAKKRIEASVRMEVVAIEVKVQEAENIVCIVKDLRVHIENEKFCSKI